MDLVQMDEKNRKKPASLVVANPDEFPSNSISERKVRARLYKPAPRRQKTLAEKTAAFIFGDTLKSATQFMATDIVIPAVQNMLTEGISGFIEMLVYGDGNNPRRSRQRGHNNYSRYYKTDPRRRDEPERDYQRTRNTRPGRTSNIIFESRSDANLVVEGLLDILEEYGEVTVADLYDLAGLDSVHADEKYGWQDLDVNRIPIVHDRRGYSLRLPPEKVLD